VAEQTATSEQSFSKAPKKINRRTFLGLSASALAGVGGGVRFGNEVENEAVAVSKVGGRFLVNLLEHGNQSEGESMGLGRGEAASFSQRIYRAADTIQPYVPAVTSLDQVRVFEKEFVPYLAADGLVPDDKLYFPPIVSKDYLSSDGSLGVFHLIGRTASCTTNKEATVTLNERLFSPDSPWQQRKQTGFIIAYAGHEICHANKVSCTYGPDSEVAAQMVAMDTLGAMAMEGNTLALPAFLCLLGEFADDYVLSRCLQEEDGLIADHMPPPSGSTPVFQQDSPSFQIPTPRPTPDIKTFRTSEGLGWYESYLKALPDGAFRVAEWDRYLDYWKQTNWDMYRDNITKYGATPYRYTAQAMKDPGFDSPVLPISGEVRPDAANIPLRMFNTHYVVSNLEDLVEEYIDTYKQLHTAS
jgi:hypothetical protein